MQRNAPNLSETALSAYFHDKNCLVLGGSGFIGSNLATKLSKLGANVTITFLNHKPNVRNPGIRALHCDATKVQDLLEALKGVEYVFIACAITSGSAVMRNTPFVHLSDNMVMNTRIFEACDQAKVKRVIFLSSSTVYPNSTQIMYETTPTGDFFSAYQIVATMKQASEKIALLYATHSKSHMETLIVRPSNSYGPNDDFNPETSKVVPALISKFSKKELPIEVWGDGKDIKDFVFIDDLIEGIVRTMAFGVNGEIYNIGFGQDSTIHEAVEILALETSVAANQIVYLEDIPSMIPVRRLSIEKARRDLGYSPKTKFSDGLKKTLDWYRRTHEIQK